MRTSYLSLLRQRASRARRFASELATALAFALLSLTPRGALAASTGGVDEWETPLALFVKSISGPIAFGISVIAIVVAGAMLVWGGEINEFARRFIMLILVIAMIVTAVNLLSTFFGVGALVL